MLIRVKSAAENARRELTELAKGVLRCEAAKATCNQYPISPGVLSNVLNSYGLDFTADFVGVSVNLGVVCKIASIIVEHDGDSVDNINDHVIRWLLKAIEAHDQQEKVTA